MQMVQGFTEEMAAQRKILDNISSVVCQKPTKPLAKDSGTAKDRKTQPKQQRKQVTKTVQPAKKEGKLLERLPKPRIGVSIDDAIKLAEAGRVTVKFARCRVWLPEKSQPGCFRCGGRGHMAVS